MKLQRLFFAAILSAFCASSAFAFDFGPPANPNPQQQPQENLILSDAQVAQILLVLNNGEIQQAQLALQKAQDQEVREFAQQMLDKHTAANQKLQALVTQFNLTTNDDAISPQLKVISDACTSLLNAFNGKQFDVVYMEGQVMSHKQVLKMIDRVLLPSSKEPQLQSYLNEVKPKVSAHLKRAIEILKRIDQQ